jgi:hypothetical protein
MLIPKIKHTAKSSALPPRRNANSTVPANAANAPPAWVNPLTVSRNILMTMHSLFQSLFRKLKQAPKIS